MDDVHSGMPYLFINVPNNNSNSNTTPIWKLNTCQLIATFSFQSFLSTVYSSKYPKFNERYNYGGLGSQYYSTFFYYNPGTSPISNFLPSGSWSTGWKYKNEEPLDFAPGSYLTIIDDVSSALSSQIQCNSPLISNNTFVSTVSALAFDTDDLFYNISVDANKLDKTPFDAIYALDTNYRHDGYNQTENIILMTNLLNEIEGKVLLAVNKNNCTKISSLTGNVLSNQTISSIENSNISTDNYTINNGAKIYLESSNNIKFNKTSAKNGSYVSAKIVNCSKGCNWSPNSERLKSLTTNYSLAPEPIYDNFISTELINQNLNEFTLSPNPNKGKFSVIAKSSNCKIEIYNSLGILVFSSVLNIGRNDININVASGFYEVRIINKLGDIISDKLVIE